jgi:primosomal protein N''
MTKEEAEREIQRLTSAAITARQKGDVFLSDELLSQREALSKKTFGNEPRYLV